MRAKLAIDDYQAWRKKRIQGLTAYYAMCLERDIAAIPESIPDEVEVLRYSGGEVEIRIGDKITWLNAGIFKAIESETEQES